MSRSRRRQLRERYAAHNGSADQQALAQSLALGEVDEEPPAEPARVVPPAETAPPAPAPTEPPAPEKAPQPRPPAGQVAERLLLSHGILLVQGTDVEKTANGGCIVRPVFQFAYRDEIQAARQR